MSLGPVNSMNNDIFVSGGFDHCIKLWDKRIDCISFIFIHSYTS